MNDRFLPYINELDVSLNTLLAMTPLTPATLSSSMPERGVYLLSEGGRHLYVGRSNSIRARLGRHSLPGASHRMAAFAFRLAREATGFLKPTYRKGDGSRNHLMTQSHFVEAFTSGKARIRAMHVRFVEEADPIKQMLLEVYVAVVLQTPYNDFDNH